MAAPYDGSPPPPDPYAPYDYDATGNYGAGYPPPYEPRPGYYPPDYQASNYDTQGNYGTGYGPNQAPPLVTWYEDGSHSTANSQRGYQTGEPMYPEANWGVDASVPSSAVPMPSAPDDAWFPNGPLKDTMGPTYEPPPPTPTLRDRYEADDEDWPSY